MSNIIEEGETLVEEGVAAVKTAVVDIGELAVAAFKDVEAAVVNDLHAAATALFSGGSINLNQSLADLEGALLMTLEHAGTELFAKAQGVGSTLLQILIGLVVHAL